VARRGVLWCLNSDCTNYYRYLERPLVRKCCLVPVLDNSRVVSKAASLSFSWKIEGVWYKIQDRDGILAKQAGLLEKKTSDMALLRKDLLQSTSHSTHIPPVPTPIGPPIQVNISGPIQAGQRLPAVGFRKGLLKLLNHCLNNAPRESLRAFKSSSLLRCFHFRARSSTSRQIGECEMPEPCRTSSKDREKCYPSMRCRPRDNCCLKPAGLITLNMARCPLDMNRVPFRLLRECQSGSPTAFAIPRAIGG